MTTVTAASVNTNLNELFSRVTALEILARENLPAHLVSRISASPVMEAGTYTTPADVANALADLSGRVATLEALAHDHLGAPLPTREVVETVSIDDTPTPEPVTTTPVVTSARGVDYGAVAYGLGQIKAKMVRHLGSSGELDREYEGAVEWFIDCFVGDSAFSADAFRRNVGL